MYTVLFILANNEFTKQGFVIYPIIRNKITKLTNHKKSTMKNITFIKLLVLIS